MSSRRSPRRQALPLLALVPLLLAACSAPSASASASPSASAGLPSASVEPSISASVEESPPASAGPTGSGEAEPADDELEPFSCEMPVDRSGSAGHAQITDVRVATHDDYDRIVFEFVGPGGSDALPAYTVEEAEPPFVQDGSGLPVAVNGEQFLRIYLFGGTKLSPAGGLTYTGSTDFDEEMPRLDELIEIGDFEAISTWVAGLNDGDGCYRVFTLTGPSRLVIDVEH